ncbi:hypothetical protein, partial [Sandarakinorhabdus sp.]|uniref:hypothetical protein n=1 Tax=Sandarakinorhabdus sp. TaxID=1916663 RepID=UPI00333E6214
MAELAAKLQHSCWRQPLSVRQAASLLKKASITMSKPTIAHCVSILLAMAVGGCANSDAVTGTAPDYPPGYQPVMGGYAA